MARFSRSLLLLLACAFLARAVDIEKRQQFPVLADGKPSSYFWKVTPVGDTAQLLTLFCRSCESPLGVAQDTPVVALLRDTLGDTNLANDRVTCVWLLSYTRPSWDKRLLSAVPFFYWRVGSGSSPDPGGRVSPLMDLTAPHHRILSGIGRDVLQWTMLDPMTTPIRASSRAYRTNEMDHERLHLEEAISYLRNAPASNDRDALTQKQLNTVTARLELRKKLLGGFASERQAAHLGKEAGFEQERIRTRNWEVLRECAERTGLLFQPLDMAGDSQQYAILWFPVAESHQPVGTALGPIWKLLNIKDPWNDERLKDWKGPVYQRTIDSNGQLVAPNEPGAGPPATTIRLMPLGVYSLNYPKVPLLLIDFRDKLHIRGHELAQRAINEITSGVIGISHFTNWYYYLGADLYNFVVSRRGSATDQAERLDCYSQFRVALALDQQLEPALRKEMQERIRSLAVNPLETAPADEIRAASVRYARLQQEAGPGGSLLSQLDKDRRSELASFGESRTSAVAHALLHAATLHRYTHRAKPDVGDLVVLDCYRRIQTQLSFLDSLVKAGTPPEVAYSSSRVQDSVTELSMLMPRVRSAKVRTHVRDTLQALQELSGDSVLRTECLGAINVLDRNGLDGRPGAAPGVIASPIPQSAETLR